MKKNAKKKKGFTLVELIAVIAILGILAAVVVPKVSSYTSQATTAAVKADSNTILNAVETYNARQSGTAIADTTIVSDLIADAKKSTPVIITDSTAASDLITVLKRIDTTKDASILSKKLSELQGN